MVLYKVVQKQTRFGSNWAIAQKKHNNYRDSITFKEAVKFRKKYPDLFPRYLIGHTLIANPKTVGFMMFKDLSHARQFQSLAGLSNITKTIQVQPLEKTTTYGRLDYCIIPNCGGDITNLLDIFNINNDPALNSILRKPQLPIVTCHKIKVLT